MAPSIALTRGLANSEEADLRAVFPRCFAVPQLHAFDDPALAGQVNRASDSARRNAITNDKFFLCAIAEVHDDALKFNGAAAHTQLNGAESPVATAYVNGIVVYPSIYVGAAKIGPTLSCIGRNTKRKNKEQGNSRYKINFLRHVPLLPFRDRSEYGTHKSCCISGTRVTARF